MRELDAAWCLESVGGHNQRSGKGCVGLGKSIHRLRRHGPRAGDGEAWEERDG